MEEVLEIICSAQLENVDAGALFCYVEEGHTYSLAVLNHEVNVLFRRIYGNRNILIFV